MEHKWNMMGDDGRVVTFKVPVGRRDSKYAKKLLEKMMEYYKDVRIWEKK